MPLIRTYILSSAKNREAWVNLVYDESARQLRFTVQRGVLLEKDRKRLNSGTCVVVDRNKKGQLLKKPTKVKATFICPVCHTGIAKGDYIDAEASAGRVGSMPVAIVTEGKGGRDYVSFSEEQELAATTETQEFISQNHLSSSFPTEPARGTFASNAQGRIYGFHTFADYFTPRQLTALTVFSQLISHVQETVRNDARSRGINDSDGYANAIATYMGFVVDKCSDYWSSLCSWHSSGQKMRNTFARQGISMAWDYAECCPFSTSTGNWTAMTDWTVKAVGTVPASAKGYVQQQDAVRHGEGHAQYLLVTDPPYYDNISYADLSDFFYVWLRKALCDIYPDLFGTMATPKEAELIAAPYRQGGKEGAKKHFEGGMRKVFRRICETSDPNFPITVIYAFKQSETDDTDDDDVDDTAESTEIVGISSTGWETFLSAMIEEGFQVTGTWPMRTELANKITSGTNILASSIALVCRPRPQTAATITRREFQSLLRSEVANAIRALQSGNIAPVDLQQSAIGPGMAVFSRYGQVLEANGKPMTVRTALQDINRTLDSVIESGDFDSATNWAISWFSQYAFKEASYGSAEILATAKAVSISGLAHDGIVQSGGNKVKLLSRDELPADYDPSKDDRVTVWEVTQYLTRALDKHGVTVAGQVMRAFRESHSEVEIERARDLAYRLFAICDTKKWSQEARPYNALVLSWSDIELESQKKEQNTIIEGGLFGNGLE